MLAYNVREPVGVVAAITPFNFPISLTCSKLAPALAAGNCVIHKPAKRTPLGANLLAELLAEAGVPDGVHNLLTGDGEKIGGKLSAHPGVDKVAFTGSTKIGVTTLKSAAETLKQVTVELGGKSPNIVLDDADLDRAADMAVEALYWNKGEVCIAGSRLLVDRKIYGELCDRLVAKVRDLRFGDPFDDDVTYGPMSSHEARESVLDFIRKGREEGARLAVGGDAGQISGKGYFIQPTLFLDARNDMAIAREEIFGPVLTVIPFDGDDDAIRIANDSPFGLASGIQTRDVARAMRLARRIKAGTVWINTWNHFDPSAPFGGYKASGYGREEGFEAVTHYTQTKTIWANVGAET